MNRSTVLSAVMLAAGLAVVAPGVVHAQGGDGYLFRRPTVSLKFAAGYEWQRASSEIYDWAVGDFTLGRRDFDSPYFGGELAVRLSDYVDLALDVGYQSSSTFSEYRDWVDLDERPITQTTTLEQVPFVATVKVYPLPKGTQLGRFAWVPRAVAPFVGVGVGGVSWDFEQDGDFVDFETLDIYSDRVLSQGTAFLVRAAAGVDISLGKHFVFTAEGRYHWADDPMEGGYVGFDPIDLDGLQLIGGIAVRF